MLSSYELVLFGYFVFGDGAGNGKCCVVTFDDWDLLTLAALLHKFMHLWNYRVKVFALKLKRVGVVEIVNEPSMVLIDDSDLQRIRWWKMSSRHIE